MKHIFFYIMWMARCMCVAYLVSTWHQDALLQAGRCSVMVWAMFCWETLVPAINVDMTLTLPPYKAINGQSSSYLEQLIIPYHLARTICSQDAGLLVIPRISKNRDSYQGPLRWNYLSGLVQEVDTLSDFKSRLKAFLFDKAYS